MRRPVFDDAALQRRQRRRLAALERLAFVLHDAFGVPFADIASALGVELRIDGGLLRPDATRLLRGAEAVAGHTATYSKLYPFVRPALVNDAAGAVIAPGGRVFSVMAFTVTDGRIIRIAALADPQRLAKLDPTLPGA